MIGSEGTLGIVTKIVVKLIPHPQQTLLMLAPFRSPEKACEAVNGIFLAGGNPSACEFVEPEGFRLSAEMTSLSFNIEEGIEGSINNIGSIFSSQSIWCCKTLRALDYR